MVMEALVYILTLLFGVSTVIIIKNKRYKVVPFICLDIILTFAGFAITSFVILFVGNEALEALLIMSVFGLFLFLLGVNDIYAVFCCNQKIEAIYCGYNSYPKDAMGLPAMHRCLNTSVTARLTMSRPH